MRKLQGRFYVSRLAAPNRRQIQSDGLGVEDPAARWQTLPPHLSLKKLDIAVLCSVPDLVRLITNLQCDVRNVDCGQCHSSYEPIEELWNMICIDLARCSVPNSFARESNLWTPSCVTLQSILFSSINKCGCSYRPWTFPERQVFGDGLRSVNNPISASLAPAGSIAGGVL